MRYAMIMAGGSGTRLWPMSRQDRPKQLIPFIGGRSLLDISCSRLEGIVPQERRLICTGEQYRKVIRAALPQFSDEQILGEPMPRNTANAVGLTAAVLARSDPDAVFAVLTADHLIEPQEEFARTFDLGFRMVEDDPTRFVTFLIRPTYPATGYGYIEQGEELPGYRNKTDRSAVSAFQVRRFFEKPDRKTAESYLKAGTFGWNSGMFIYHAGTFMSVLSRFLPESYEGLMKIAEAWATEERKVVLESVYPSLPRISVDHAVMEPASVDDEVSVCTVPMNVMWMDVGSWSSYGQTLPSDQFNNRTNVRAIHLDSQNVFAIADEGQLKPGQRSGGTAHTIATIGCENLIIVCTADATLVCRADLAEKVKELVEHVDDDLR